MVTLTEKPIQKDSGGSKYKDHMSREKARKKLSWYRFPHGEKCFKNLTLLWRLI